ncbi:hypothetical protein FPQ18DRAFT_99453 [Pyronema domesticum]|uniref:Uncharacterized protein n=1 Tax=Pyronema omphalodes (strain CBS 100304) TaxID=1076935 RepID=U4LGV2_PYROM|nr:hypothetical protein FPQ18DRAFT_99453 [Pyronema domesticum]CCX31314.1 Similar to hypothetical protein [Tuber melanosporum Mel28]; acc. no. XP_002835911 [Pyronema omphalodes CBS 100304]
MSSFLRRSKSSRDPRRQALSRDQQQDEFGTPPPLPLSQLSDLPFRSQYPVYSESITPPQEYSKRTPRKLTRRKSISSVRESIMLVGHLPDTWEQPATANPISASEMKKRTSIFFGLSSPSPPLPTTPVPTKKAPPPPIRLSAFPFPARSPEYPIGVALGSPSAALAGAFINRPAFESVDTLSSGKKTQKNSPAFFLPAKPFGVTTHVEANNHKSGWKRIKGIFSRKPSVAGEKAEKAAQKAEKRTHSRSKSQAQLRPASSKSNVQSRPSSRIQSRHAPSLSETSQTSLPSVASQVSLASRTTTPDLIEHLTVPPASGRHWWSTNKEPVKTPHLDVDIPGVEMERYSVMFGNILPPSEKSSLFARRRSREAPADITFSDHDCDEAQDALAALTANTSRPALKRSTTVGSHLSPRSPLGCLESNLRRISSESRRSGTSITPVPSPGLGRSNTFAADGRRGGLLTISPQEQYLITPSPPEEYPASAVSRISEESSIATPTGSFEEGDDRWLASRDSFEDHEPAWEMVTKESLREGSKKSEESARIEPEMDPLAKAAEISIARQISLSQKQLLIPVVPKNMRLVSRRSMKEVQRRETVRKRRSNTMPGKLVEQKGKEEDDDWDGKKRGVVEI